MSKPMDQSVTYILMALVIAICAIALYKARQPKELGKSWHTPWNGILFLGILSLLLLTRHLLSLHGIELPDRQG